MRRRVILSRYPVALFKVIKRSLQARPCCNLGRFIKRRVSVTGSMQPACKCWSPPRAGFLPILAGKASNIFKIINYNLLYMWKNQTVYKYVISRFEPTIPHLSRPYWQTPVLNHSAMAPFVQEWTVYYSNWYVVLTQSCFCLFCFINCECACWLVPNVDCQVKFQDVLNESEIRHVKYFSQRRSLGFWRPGRRLPFCPSPDHPKENFLIHQLCEIA